MNLIFGLYKILLIISIFFDISQTVDFCDDVKTWGFHCKSCSTMIKCIQTATGNWQTISVGECDNSKFEYCNRKEETCSKKQDCTVDKPVQFECNAVGIFPDPYECSKYHLCANETGVLKSFNMECSDNLAYSSKTKECSLNKTQSKFCKNRQFICEKSGDMAPWPENPQLFYVCVPNINGTGTIVHPKLFTCKYGEKFNGQKCTKKNNSITMPPQTSEGPEEDQTVKSCKKEGLNKNPNDCKKYFLCDKNLVRQNRICPNYTHFDERMKACVIGAKC